MKTIDEYLREELEGGAPMEKTASADAFEAELGDMELDELEGFMEKLGMAVPGQPVDQPADDTPLMEKLAWADQAGRELAHTNLEMAEAAPSETATVKAQILGDYMDKAAGLGFEARCAIAAEAGQEMAKVAVIGPLIDAGNLGIPSGIGYAMGNEAGRSKAREGKRLGSRNVPAALLVPGALGYRAGKTRGYRKEKREMRDEDRKKVAGILGTLAGHGLAGAGVGAGAGALSDSKDRMRGAKRGAAIGGGIGLGAGLGAMAGLRASMPASTRRALRKRLEQGGDITKGDITRRMRRGAAASALAGGVAGGATGHYATKKKHKN